MSITTPRRDLGIAAALAVAAIAPCCRADLLYDVDFSSPFHTPGDPVSVDLGPAVRQGPSSLPFGDPTVVAKHGAFTDGAARFAVDSPPYSLSQMRFALEDEFTGLGIDFPAYRMAFDVEIDHLGFAGDSFVIVFDGPIVNTFEFRGDGLIQYGGGASFIGTFEEDDPMHVEVDFHGDENWWSITVDDVLLYDGSLQQSYEALRSIRLSLGEHVDIDSVVYLDNVVIEGIPAPSVAALFVIGGALGALRRRRLG